MIRRDRLYTQRSHLTFGLLALEVLTFTRHGFAQAKSAAPAANEAATEAAGATPAPGAPSKEALQEAGEHYGRGLTLYSEGDYALAVIEFDRAYALVSDFRVLYNIGQVRVQLSNYSKARRALELYLSEGGDKVSAERRQSVAADLQMLAARTATLQVETNVAGALISIDDVQVGTSPLPAPLLLDAGDHRVVVRKPGFNSADTRLVLAGGDATSTRLDLVPEARAAAPRTIVEKRYLEKSDHTAWVWATWTATGVFAVGGAAIGGLGLKTANDLDKLRQSDDTTRAELDSTQRRARTLLTAGDVLGGAALLTGGIALYLTLTNRTESAKATANRSSHPHVEVALAPNWVGLSGSY